MAAADERAIEAEVQRVFELNQRYFELVSGTPLDDQRLGAPATEEQVSRLETRLGYKLPPTYRTFLLLHNGWEGFKGDQKLLSTEDHQKGPYAKTVRDLKRQAFEDGDALIVEGLVICIESGNTTSCVVIDTSETDRRGEMEVAVWELEEVGRYKDFLEFLKATAKILEKSIAAEERQKGKKK